MSKVVASGEIIKTDDLVVAATVTVETVKSEESGSGTEEKHFVALNAKCYDAGEFPADPLTYADIEAMVESAEESGSGAGMVVPTIDGEDVIALEAPVAIKYAKTKAFEVDGKVCVFCTLRYEY